MDRRTVLAGLGTTLTAGCVSSSQGGWWENATVTETPEPTTEETTERTRHWYLLAKWVEESPPEVTPYPSDESPVTDFEVVLEVFERADEQSKADLPPERQPDVGFGDGVSEQISDEKKDAIQREFSDIEMFKSSQHEGDHPSGRYFDHDGTIITLHLGRPD